MIKNTLSIILVILALTLMGCGDKCLAVGDEVKTIDSGEKWIIIHDEYGPKVTIAKDTAGTAKMDIDKDLIRRWTDVDQARLDSAKPQGFQFIQEHEGKRYILVQIPEGLSVVDGKVYDLRDKELTYKEIIQLSAEIKKEE